LVFYHFGTVAELTAAACRAAVEDAIATYREDFAAISTLADLLGLGRVLHERELASGNVVMMAELMSGAQSDPALADLARHAMDSWNRELEPVLRRVLHSSPLAEIIDPAGLTRAISAGFIGLELYERADLDGATKALAALESLAVLAGVLDDLGPVARRAIRAKLRGTRRSPSPT
jgi:AcrR family transcriptional regulator